MKCLNNWCLENFPFLEDDIKGLTEYEIICKLYEYIKNVAGDVSNLTEDYQDLINQFEELKEYVNTYLTDMDEVKEAIILINQAIETLNTATSNNTNRIEEVNTSLTNLINSDFNSLKTYVDNQDNMLNNKIDNIQIGAIQIYDPTTGTIEPLQTVINNLYQLGNVDGLTATEFDGLDLTATAFEAYQITAYEFDSQGKTILV